MITPDVDFFGTSSSRLFPGLVTTVGELSTSSFGNRLTAQGKQE